MSSATELQAAGVKLSIGNGKLICDGPEELLTPQVIEYLKENKLAIIEQVKCGNCEQYENITDIGSGCVRQLPAGHKYSEEWRRLDLLNKCPYGLRASQFHSTTVRCNKYMDPNTERGKP